MNQPNILFILADQLRPDFLGYHGFRAIQTPNIDRLASESLSYDQAISACPICVPARAALLTGLSSLKTGVIGNDYWLRPDRTEMGISTWPALLGEAGYQTAAVGKMHFYPWESSEGFQERVIAEDKRWPLIEDDYFDFLKKRGEAKRFAFEDPQYKANYGAVLNHLPVEATTDRFVTDRACEYLRKQKGEKPFALMVGYPGPHCPYDALPEYLKQVDVSALPEPIEDRWEGGAKESAKAAFIRGMKEPWHQIDYTEFPREARMKVKAHYAALVKQIDDEVGTLLQTLSDQGLLEKTIVIFTSDHGDFLGDRGLVGKKFFYEPSIRIPMLVRVPGGVGKKSDDLVELRDITSTILSFCGVALPSYMDSVPLPGLGLPGAKRMHVTGFLQGQAMVRSGAWKLTRYANGVQELFNLEEDPQEQTNRLGDESLKSLVVELNDLLWKDLFEGTTGASQDIALRSEIPMYQDPAFSRRGGWKRTYPEKLKL